MARPLVVLALVAVLQAGLLTTRAVAATTPPAPGLSVELLASPVNLADESVQCLRGARPCAGYGTENCCGEMEALGFIAAASANWWAAAIAVAYSVAYCN